LVNTGEAVTEDMQEDEDREHAAAQMNADAARDEEKKDDAE
jgi:hypothetical protein